MNRPPACIFQVNEMGNKEFTWSGLKYYVYTVSTYSSTIIKSTINKQLTFAKW